MWWTRGVQFGAPGSRLQRPYRRQPVSRSSTYRTRSVSDMSQLAASDDGCEFQVDDNLLGDFGWIFRRWLLEGAQHFHDLAHSHCERARPAPRTSQMGDTLALGVPPCGHRRRDQLLGPRYVMYARMDWHVRVIIAPLNSNSIVTRCRKVGGMLGARGGQSAGNSPSQMRRGWARRPPSGPVGESGM